MPWGLRLVQTARDRAALGALLARAPDLLAASWHTWRVDEGAGAAVVVASATLRRTDAVALAALGFDVVLVETDAVTGDPVARSPRDDERTPLVRGPRVAEGLLTAVPPVVIVQRAPPAEAVFVVDDPAATASLFERLLLLERGDARVAALALGVSDAAALTVARVMAPPLWLVLKYAEEPAGVRVFVRPDEAGGSLFVAHGHAHPLADRLEAALRARGEIGLVDDNGHLWRTRAPWPERSIHDALRPELPAMTTTLTAAPLSTSFVIRLRLGAALPADEGAEPELFVLADDDVARLERFVEAALPEEIERLLLTRVDDGTGRALVVLREAVRPGASRLGARLQTALAVRGFVRVAGHDGLFVPPGRRLQPTLRRDDLRALLGLEAVAAVLVDEDADGLRLLRLPSLADEPAARLVRYIATQRRQELDRILEDAVLTFPGLSLARPREAGTERLRDVLEQSHSDARHKKRKIVVTAVEPTPASRPQRVTGDEAAWKARAAVLEQQLVIGSDDAAAWQELAALKLALRDRADAVAAAAVAAFLDPSTAASTLVQATTPARPLAELARSGAPTVAEAEALCAQVLAALQPGAPDAAALDDEVARVVVEVVVRPGFLAARRLQWAALRGLHARTADALGLTRARERVLGVLNAQGLREGVDLPRFVRAALSSTTATAASSLSSSAADALGAFARWEQGRTGGRDVVLRSVLAHGVARSGGDARTLLEDVERRAQQRGGPLVAIAQLYASRLGFVQAGSTAGADDAWRLEVERTLAAVEHGEDRRVVEWLVKRSRWLAVAPRSAAPQGLRPALERIVTAATARPDVVDLVNAAAQAAQVRGCFDFERAVALERLLVFALRGGRDDTIVGVARVAHGVAGELRILSHRALLLGQVVRAAATTGETALVNRCLEDVTAIAMSRAAPSTRDLLLALRPSLAALRRLGEIAAARRCLNAFALLTRDVVMRETAPLAAALAEGYRALGDDDAAAAMLATAWATLTAPATGHVDRFDAGCAVAEALAHWPSVERVARCGALLGDLEPFRDTFTLGVWFAGHRVLLAERLVDCLVDEQTERSDRLQRWLDEDEARIRRRILADWRAALAG
ncbi:MAG: hypothetical protein FJ137_16705 [Deltaproteobacteria bacterium]|nr:hypothetical protein [Deltaproteobacteria bacterium]